MYTYTSRIAYTETDINNILKPESMIDYFQNCSTFQTQDSAAPIERQRKLGVVWVINSWQIELLRLPRLGERVVIGTIPYEMKGFMGLRNFFMDTEDGERLSLANSVWSLIDLDTMRPARIPKEIIDAYPVDAPLEMEHLPRKVTLPDTERQTLSPVRVETHHLDSNRHVNNGQYVRIALDSVRANIPEDSALSIRRIRADYRAQARLGDTLIPVLAASGTTYTVSLDSPDGTTYSVVELSADSP